MFCNILGQNPNRLLSHNNRQYSTMGVHPVQPKDMVFKPEYLMNKHISLMENLGLANQFLPNKKFSNPNFVNNQNPNIHSCQNKINLDNYPKFECVSNVNFTPCRQNLYNGYSDGVSFRNRLNYYEKPNLNQSQTDIKPNTAECSTESDTRRTETEMLAKTENKEDAKAQDTSKNSKRKKCKKSKMRKQERKEMKPTKKGSAKSCNKRQFHKQSKQETDRNLCPPTTHSKKSSKKCKSKHKKQHMDLIEIENIALDMFDISENPIDCCESNTVIPNKNLCIPAAVISLCIKKPEKSPVKPIDITKTAPKPSMASSSICIGIALSRAKESPKCLSFRQRLLSDCGSEDSFIIFDGGTDVEEDEIESDSALSGNDCSDTDDMEFSYPSDTDSSKTRCKSCPPLKQVRFAEPKELCRVYPMIKWAYAYQAARIGPWEQCARDRERFRKRISDMEQVLDTVLQPGHRTAVYEDRFQQQIF